MIDNIDSVLPFTQLASLAHTIRKQSHNKPAGYSKLYIVSKRERRFMKTERLKEEILGRDKGPEHIQ